MSVGAVNKNTGERIPTAGMPAIDDALDLTSVNPVQNAIVTAALALKQDKTDNSLQTTDKTVVGAINEHEGDIDSLKSGLTNVDVALSVPKNSGKNLIPMTLAGIKSANTNGTWADNVYTLGGLTFTVLTDSAGNVIGVNANGTAPADDVYFSLGDIDFEIDKSYRMTSGTTGSATDTYRLWAYSSTAFPVGHRLSTDANCGENVARDARANERCFITFMIMSGYAPNNVTVYPMVRFASVSDPTFAPYIPSVDSRIEAVEINLLYFGKGTHDFKKTVYCGYISGSGNYLDFFVPCKYDNTISTVTLNNSALMSIYTFDGTLLTQGYIDFTVVSLEKTIGGLRIELKFNNTQTTYINTIANIAFGNDSVFTFA